MITLIKTKYRTARKNTECPELGLVKTIEIHVESNCNVAQARRSAIRKLLRAVNKTEANYAFINDMGYTPTELGVIYYIIGEARGKK